MIEQIQELLSESDCSCDHIHGKTSRLLAQKKIPKKKFQKKSANQNVMALSRFFIREIFFRTFFLRQQPRPLPVQIGHEQFSSTMTT